MKKNITKKSTYGISPMILIVMIIGVWFFLDWKGQLNTVILPSPKRVFSTAIELLQSGSLWEHLLVSMGRVFQGYAIAAVLGITLGILFGIFPTFHHFSHMLIQLVKPIPPIAWIPLVILWFGIGESGKIFLIFLGGFFVILTNVVDGIRQTDERLLEVSKSVETPFFKHIFQVLIPWAAPNIFTGLRTGLSSCWMCVVAAELVSSATGIGYLIMNARQFGRTDMVLVGMITIGMVGKLMDSLLQIAERKIIKWQ